MGAAVILTRDAALTIIFIKVRPGGNVESAAEAHTAAVFRKNEMVNVMPHRYDVPFHGFDLVYFTKLIAQICCYLGKFR